MSVLIENEVGMRTVQYSELNSRILVTETHRMRATHATHTQNQNTGKPVVPVEKLRACVLVRVCVCAYACACACLRVHAPANAHTRTGCRDSGRVGTLVEFATLVTLVVTGVARFPPPRPSGKCRENRVC